MTEQSTRDQLREAAEGHLLFGGGEDDLADGVLPLLDQLDRAEHRIARLEAQTSIRGRAVVMYRERAREADTRIKAVQHLIDQADEAGDWTVTCSRLQWAIDGEVV